MKQIWQTVYQVKAFETSVGKFSIRKNSDMIFVNVDPEKLLFGSLLQMDVFLAKELASLMKKCFIRMN